MTVYMVGYDLNKAGKNYEGLIEKIKELANGYWHHLDSTWLINSIQTAEQIRNALKPFLDADDELLVCVVSAPGAWHGINAAGSKWLHENLK